MWSLGSKTSAEDEMKVLYRAWEGRLFIHNQRVCDIALRSPFQTSIPAQLPARLDFKYIVQISELRKKLPEAAFKKNSYSNDEVCCQQLSFRLYEVEIRHESELKDQLIGSMKEKQLALVRYLNDRSILLFLTSSVLVKEKDAEANDLTSLQALFLFPSPGPRYLTARDWRREEGRRGRQLPLVLPLFHQALMEAAKSPDPKRSPSSALVKSHMEEFAKLDPSSAPTCGSAAGPPSASKLPSGTREGDPADDTRPPPSLSDFVFYLSDPESYTLEVSSAVACLKGGASDGGEGLNLNPLPSGGLDNAMGTGKAPSSGHGPSRDAGPRSSPAGERSLPWTKRKSSRILGASSKKKWSPLKMYCALESSRKKTKEKEKRKKKKKKKKPPKEATPLDVPLTKDPGSPSDSKEPTLKLKNIQNPLKRKRGAEVLSAEFIQGTKGASPKGATGFSGRPATEEKKPRLNEAEKAKSVDKMDAKTPTPRKNVHSVSSEKQRTEAVSVEKETAAGEVPRTSGREDCDSHALNLLADLALSSCNSPLDGNSRRDLGRFRPSREHRLPRGKFLPKSSDHEYHRATKKWKSAFLSGQTAQSSRETSRDRDPSRNAKDRSAAHPGKKKARTELVIPPPVLPNETGDLSDSSVIISLEHSYASAVSETPKKWTPLSPTSKNGVMKPDKPGPLVGKVLPFQHRQNSCQPDKPPANHLPTARSTVMATRLREDFSACRQVTSCEKTVQVTFQWEAEYLFDLDSKYTNDSLEKTVIRAVHGPWDESLSDNMEDMRLILHMWMALFYSRQFQALTTRKVVEHSNPAKYVSLNSLVDPSEALGEGGGDGALAERPAGSPSEAAQMPAEGGGDGPVPPSERLLSCNRLSTANSLVDESPLADVEGPEGLLEEEEPSRPSPKSVEEAVRAEPKEQTSLTPVALPIENLPEVDELVNPPTCQATADRSPENKSVGASQSDGPAYTGLSEHSRNQQPVGSTEVAVSVASRGIDTAPAPSSEEVKKDNFPAGGPSLGTSKEVGSKAEVKSRESTSPRSKVQKQPGLHKEEEDGESMDLGSIDLALSESNDADMEVQNMDLDPEDKENLEESVVKGRKEADNMYDEASSRHSPLPSKASLGALSGNQTEFLGVQEDAVGPSPSSVPPNQMELMDPVPQRASLLYPVTVDEKMAGSTKKMEPTSPKQIDKAENSRDEAIVADSASIQATGGIADDLATQDGPLQSQASLESVKSPGALTQVDVVDLSSVSQEDDGNRLPSPPSRQASPVRQRASDEEPPSIQEGRLENSPYDIFQNAMDLIEDISQDSTEAADPAVHICESNSDLCVNSVPNSISTHQKLVENQDSSVASTQSLPFAKDMGVVESPKGDDSSRPPHQQNSDEAAELDVLENSSIPQEKDVIHPTDKVLGQVNEPHIVQFDFGTREEQETSQGEEFLVEAQPAKEHPSLKSHDVDFETSSKNETCLDQGNTRDSSASQETTSEDGVEKPTVARAAVAEEVHALMNELVNTVCTMILQTEEVNAPKSLDWINSAMLESVTPPESDEEGCPAQQHSHEDLKWAGECLEESSTFDDREGDLQARVQGRGESCSSPNENITSDPEDDREGDLQARVQGRAESCLSPNENMTSDPGNAPEKADLQGNDTTSAAMEIFSSCGSSQAELGTTNPEGGCSWLETTESLEVGDCGVSTLEKVEQTKVSPEEPLWDKEDCPRVEGVGISPFVPEECQEEFLGEKPDSLVDGDSRQAPDVREEEAQVEAKGCPGSPEEPLLEERAQMPTGSSGMNMDWEDGSLMADNSQEPCIDWYSARKLESVYQPRFKASPSIESEFTSSSGPGKETFNDGDWVSSEASQKTSDPGSLKHNFPFGFKKEDWSMLLSLDVDRKPKPFKDYVNFSITKKHKEKTRTFHPFSKVRNPFSRDLGLINSWSRNCGFLSDPVQNILDLESLRFHFRIQQILKRSQRSTSRVLPTKKVPPQGGTAQVLLPKTVSEGTMAWFPARSRSPLLVTVINPNPPTSYRCEDLYGSFPAPRVPFGPAAAPRGQGGSRRPFPPLHLQKLNYHKLNRFSQDVSSVVEDLAEFSRVMALESLRTCPLERDPTATSGEAGAKRYPPRPPRTLDYKDLLAELRNTLHFQLKNVAQDACRKPFSFYLMETEDDPFFGRVKSLLKRGGHSEVDVLQFCKGCDAEAETLLVIVRNEDIFSHIHEVPSLLRLKHRPNVTFAGVDCPEDALDHSYQELFHSGGFVVSDDNMLEGMTVGELKDVMKALEKLNCHGRWKWLLHYRESKKLKEDARGDPSAHTKESVLKSCQVANITEVLHYHTCDSRSCARFERFNCLLNLQIQHITKRFAVFLTENASACREALEEKGILGLDVAGFIAAAQEMVAPLGSGFW